MCSCWGYKQHHQPWHDKRVVDEWFLRPAFDMALDSSDNSTQLHDRVLNEPIRLCLLSLRPPWYLLLCRLHLPISERDYCRLCVALQRDFSINQQSRALQHDVLVSIFTETQVIDSSEID